MDKTVAWTSGSSWGWAVPPKPHPLGWLSLKLTLRYLAGPVPRRTVLELGRLVGESSVLSTRSRDGQLSGLDNSARKGTMVPTS